MKIQSIIAVPLTSIGLHGGYRGDAWFKGRLEVFKNYTLKSLLNQSDRDFILWIWMRPEEKSNPMVHELADYLVKIGLPFIFTFESTMYIDDKFVNYTLKKRIRNLLMMLWDCWQYKELRDPINILKHSWQNKNDTLLERLGRALPLIMRSNAKNADWIYLTRLDSDDMLHRDAIKIIKDVTPSLKRCILMNKGYVINKQTSQVADWIPTTNPPFHTIVFPRDVFFDARQHLQYYGVFKSHEDPPKIFEGVTIPDDHYCYTIDRGNISTYWNTNQLYLVSASESGNIGTHWKLNRLRTWWAKKKGLKVERGIHPFIGKEYFGDDKKNILKMFGLGDKPTIGPFIVTVDGKVLRKE